MLGEVTRLVLPGLLTLFLRLAADMWVTRRPLPSSPPLHGMCANERPRGATGTHLEVEEQGLGWRGGVVDAN